MGLGVCCQWLEPQTNRNGKVTYVNSIKESVLQLGKHNRGQYTTSHVLSCYRANVKSLQAVVPKLVNAGIDNFRMSSSLFPLLDKYHAQASQDNQLVDELRRLGSMFLTSGIRVTTHPGQFTVLSSDSVDVVTNSVRELTMQAWVFDTMGFAQSPYHAVNIHGGKANRAKQLVSVINDLPTHVKSRLTLENDESCYSLLQLLAVHELTGVPVVFDSHHHSFNTDGLQPEDAYQLSLHTWRKHPGIKPLQHVSNSSPDLDSTASFQELRKHSDYIQTVPLFQLEGVKSGTIDLDVEAKMKNLAVIKLKPLLSG